MGFVVNRPVGTKNGEYEAYVRLLRQRGIDLGNSDRVPDPGTHRQWLYVWPTRDAAEEFAGALRDQTRDREWAVQAVNAHAFQGAVRAGPGPDVSAGQRVALLRFTRSAAAWSGRRTRTPSRRAPA